MTDRKLRNLLAVGLPSALAAKAVSKGFSLTRLKQASKRELQRAFERNEVRDLKTAVARRAIPGETIERLITECGWKCCLCWRFRDEQCVVIHHIEKHAQTQDDSFDNLVVLCLQHHALAHSTWEICRHPAPPDLIRQRKAEWIAAVREFKAGERGAPGHEGEGPKEHADTEFLRHMRDFLDRPAMRQPFHAEGNMSDFHVAITDIVRALNTGILQTREGVEIGRTKPVGDLSNPIWREKMALVRDHIEALRTRFEIAVRNNEMIFRDNGFYAFHNQDLPAEIDALRGTIIVLANQVLREAGVPILPGMHRYPPQW